MQKIVVAAPTHVFSTRHLGIGVDNLENNFVHRAWRNPQYRTCFLHTGLAFYLLLLGGSLASSHAVTIDEGLENIGIRYGYMF